MEQAQIKTYTSKEVCRILQITKVTLFKYLKMGIVAERRNPVNNYRVFVNEDIIKLQDLILGNLPKNETETQKTN